MNKPKKPTVGDTVHFVSTSYVHCAAIVIGITSTELVNLAVFGDGSTYGAGPTQVSAVLFSDDPQPHTWHWPEKP